MTIGSSIVIGEVYECWTVIRRTSDRRRVRFICKCSCGREVDVLAQNLTNKSSKKCRSCASHERAHLIGMDRATYARLYHQARGAIRRCTDIANPQYLNYGGRGISVYPDWVADIKLFVEYLASLAGHDDTQLVLDRVDNNGNYEPNNLRFATWSESNYNRRLPSRKGV